MDRWARMVDHLLVDVIGDGDISDLPGAGKPLSLDEARHTPPDQRMAFKIMRDNEVVPEWIAMGKALEQSEAQIRAEIASRAAREGAASGDSKHAGREWSRYVNRLEARIQRHNRAVLLHNLKAPAGIAHKSILLSENLLADARAAARSQA